MTGLWMFAAAIAAILLTGLPVYSVLLLVASLFALGGVLSGTLDASLLQALPSRLVGLLEHDLLQALPLYALMGALLNRLPLAGDLHRVGQKIAARSPAAPELSALAVGALLSPLNGSVGASLHTLSRRVVPQLLQAGVVPGKAVATWCVSSTLGVVIPPSLVLLLLGDAMMRAHTEAVNLSGLAVRIVNTQDVMRAALVPGALVLVLSMAWVAWRERRNAVTQIEVTRSQIITTLGVALTLGGLLMGVASGRFYAVEAAATGCGLLMLYAGLRGHFTRQLLSQVLSDAMSLTGMLFALLVAATAFSLILRGFATDRLVADVLATLSAHPMGLLACVLAGLVVASFVLDAFEMIFLVIPLVMPAVLRVVPDAAWVATLTLLVLQAGFLLPPFGYAVLMSQALSPVRVGLKAVSVALLPHLVILAALIVSVFLWPGLTQWNRPNDAPSNTQIMSTEEAERLMQGAGRDEEPSTP